MFLDPFFNPRNDGIHVSRQQASDFAKSMADDFNPLHDIDAKRFCVPGDLLFALVLSKYGLSEKMSFNFSGMVGDDVTLHFPENNTGSIKVTDGAEKEFLSIESSGDTITDSDVITKLASNYVTFSGKNFPHVLVPLMAEQNVMINPDRPLVMYQSMSINLNTLDFEEPVLEASQATLEVNGKRGHASLGFCIKASGEIIGEGVKRLVISGLREYEQDKIDQLVTTYTDRKKLYQKNQ
ncbi:MAG: DUF3581 domain-containing protein [Gammaproteobacteria bacterium]|nr:DUF3581 domain-containing protein [Gammaproteobacteria bacterium]